MQERGGCCTQASAGSHNTEARANWKWGSKACIGLLPTKAGGDALQAPTCLHTDTQRTGCACGTLIKGALPGAQCGTQLTASVPVSRSCSTETCLQGSLPSWAAHRNRGCRFFLLQGDGPNSSTGDVLRGQSPEMSETWPQDGWGHPPVDIFQLHESIPLQ